MTGNSLGRRRMLCGIWGSLLSSTLGCESRRVDPNTASLWFSYGGTNREVLLELVDRFKLTQKELSVRAIYQGDYFEALAKLRTALAAKTPPSLTHVVVEVLPYLYEANVLEPLDSSRFPNLVPELSQEGTFDARDVPLVGVPFNRSTPIVYYNRDIFEGAALAPPRTWAELRDSARQLTRRDPKDATLQWGFSCPIDWWFWVALLGQAGGRLVEDGQVTLGGDAGIRALRFWQDLVHEDRTMKPPPGRDYNAWQAANNDFLSGRVAMIWSSTAFMRYLEKNAAFRVGVAPLPKQERFCVPTGGTMFVVPRGIPRAEMDIALRFLQFMTEAPQANHFATKTGYLPVNRLGREKLRIDGFYAAHPNDEVAEAQLSRVSPWPWSTELFRIQREAVQPRLEQAVLLKRDAAETMREALRASRT